MNFGQAIEAMKAMKLIRRAGWNGKGMYVYLENFPPGRTSGRVYAPYMVLFTGLSIHQPGWNASTADVLAEDWEIVERV